MFVCNKVQSSLDSLFSCALENLSKEKEDYKKILTNTTYNVNFNVLCFHFPRQFGYSTWVLEKVLNINDNSQYRVLILTTTPEQIKWYNKDTIHSERIQKITNGGYSTKVLKNKKKEQKLLEQIDFVFIDAVNYIQNDVRDFILENFKGKLIVSNVPMS